MKLASIKNNSRDGELVVVSKDLKFAVKVPQIAKTMQQALDHWDDCVGMLQAVYEKLNKGSMDDSFSFDESACESPLPRAYQWADGSAYVNHVELVRKARGVEMPENFWHDPLMYQGGSDCFIGPRDDICFESEEWGIDFEAEIAIVTGDVAMGTHASVASKHIKLFMLVNDVSLRALIPGELAKSFGFYQSKPSSAFSPVAVTPDEFATAWDGEKVHLPMNVMYNDQLIGQPQAGDDMTFNFCQLIQHAAKTRPLRAGTIIGSGTVSNYDRSRGSSCLAEIRMLETIEMGSAKTPFMKFGDSVTIQMFDENNNSIFGAIHQKVKQYVTETASLVS